MPLANIFKFFSEALKQNEIQDKKEDFWTVKSKYCSQKLEIELEFLLP